MTGVLSQGEVCLAEARARPQLAEEIAHALRAPHAF